VQGQEIPLTETRYQTEKEQDSSKLDLSSGNIATGRAPGEQNRCLTPRT